jgi:hypothetical protein
MDEVTARPVKVVYITGSGRSGSTLLERLLGHVPGFLAAGEVRYIWQRGFTNNELCSCGRPFLECRFWEQVIDSAFGDKEWTSHERLVELTNRRNRARFIPMARFPALRTETFRSDLAELEAALLPLYRSLTTVSGATHVIDSSKAPSYAFLLATIPAIELYVVHLVRDSRAVAHSWSKTVVRPEIPTRPVHMGQMGAAASAQNWMTTNAIAELLRFSSTAYVRVRYEDLAAAPDQAIESILRATRHSGASSRPMTDQPREVALPSLYHTVAGNPIRFQHRVLPIRLDAEWRAKLSTSHKWIVSAITLPLLLRYGYRLPS